MLTKGKITDATYDSPHKTGRHVPLHRQGDLASIATASESRHDITSPYVDEFGRQSSSGFDTAYGGPSISPAPMSPGPNRPYSPGMRSLNAQRPDGFETHSPNGEIPMQSFQDGLPPPPSVESSWAKIDDWAEEHYPELFDQICEGCTINDINELEHQLDCTLPQDVRQSLQIHDGQERGGRPTGIIFSGMLLDCEEIVQEWENWRIVNQEFLLDRAIATRPSVPSKALGGSSSGEASSSKAAQSPGPNRGNPNWRQDLLARQDSVPPGAVQRAYAHPAWIPLVRDWGGNNLAVDLAPGPRGRWGQIILFGRDYDTKYVVARSWASFLAIVADDLKSGRWFIDDETHELKLREFKSSRVEPAYFDILRWRMDQKYGNTANKRRSMAPNGTRSPSAVPSSPYASPTEGPNGEPRGRSLQRLSTGGSGSSPVISPIRPGAGGFGKPSPLARVAEEAPAPLAAANVNVSSREKLVEVDTPRVSGEGNKENVSGAAGEGTSSKIATVTEDDESDSERTATDAEQQAQNGKAIANGKAVEQVNGKQPVIEVEAMKEIEI